jgi:SAM-dependent methyltransferase
MAFREHRGQGISRQTISEMSRIWDAHWTGKPGTELSESTLHWQIMKQHIKPPGRVLEAGCGLARWVKFLCDKGFDAYGIDFSSVAIETSQRKWPELKDKLSMGDLRKMPYEGNFFDAIVSFGAVEHDEEGPQDALHDMLRVLKPGGVLYCTVPCMNRLRVMGLMALIDWVVCNRTIRRWTGRDPEVAFFAYYFYRREYRRIMQEAGFEVLGVHPLTPWEGFSGRPDTIRYKIVQGLHRVTPWTFAHMMAAICRKPATTCVPR